MISDTNIYVNRDSCYACGTCVERCIMDNLRLFLAPCRTACPLHMNCQGYVRLIAQGKELEAVKEMPAFQMELDEALEEGVALQCCRGPREFVYQDGKIKVELKDV